MKYKIRLKYYKHTKWIKQNAYIHIGHSHYFSWWMWEVFLWDKIYKIQYYLCLQFIFLSLFRMDILLFILIRIEKIEIHQTQKKNYKTWYWYEIKVKSK